jgi:hypothetical protein
VMPENMVHCEYELFKHSISPKHFSVVSWCYQTPTVRIRALTARCHLMDQRSAKLPSLPAELCTLTRMRYLHTLSR